jgi:hypothetical protein
MVMALKFTARLDLAQFLWHAVDKSIVSAVAFHRAMPLSSGAARVRAHTTARIQSIAAHSSCFCVGSRPPLVFDRLVRVRHTAPQQTLALKDAALTCAARSPSRRSSASTFS